MVIFLHILFYYSKIPQGLQPGNTAKKRLRKYGKKEAAEIRSLFYFS